MIKKFAKSRISDSCEQIALDLKSKLMKLENHDVKSLVMADGSGLQYFNSCLIPRPKTKLMFTGPVYG